MMDHLEATASLDIFSNLIINLCAAYNAQTSIPEHEKKKENIEFIIGELKRKQKEALVF